MGLKAMAVKMATSKKMSTAGEAATNRITDTAAMGDIVMGGDTVDTNCTMGAATVVDMEVTNPVTVAGMEVTEVTKPDMVAGMEVTEVTKPGMVADMEVTDTIMADTGDTDTTRGMVMDLLMEAWEAMAVTEVTEPWEAMEVTEAPMENTILRMKRRTKQQKILKDTKSPNLTIPMLTTIFIKFMTMWMPETITKLTTFKSK